MSKTDIQAVAFDKDGTLFDSERVYAEALLMTCAQLGYALDDALRGQFVGLAAASSLKLLESRFGEGFDAQHFATTWLNNRDTLIAEQGMAMMPGAEDAVRRCHAAGYPLALVTSDNHDGVLHDFAHIEADLMAYFSVVVTVDDVSHPKPNPEPYVRAAAYLGVDTQAMLVVEDSLHGANAALAAGCPLALYPSAPLPADITERAALILQRITDIEALL